MNYKKKYEKYKKKYLIAKLSGGYTEHSDYTDGKKDGLAAYNDWVPLFMQRSYTGTVQYNSGYEAGLNEGRINAAMEAEHKEREAKIEAKPKEDGG